MQPQSYPEDRLVQFLGGRKWSIGKALKSLAGFHELDQQHGILQAALDDMMPVITTGMFSVCRLCGMLTMA